MNESSENPATDKESFLGWGFRTCWIDNNPIVKQLTIGIVLGFTLISIGYVMIKKRDQK